MTFSAPKDAGNSKGNLPPRKTAEHQTDTKAPYNNVYEAAGMKKIIEENLKE
jgi:hypothetical protein